MTCPYVKRLSLISLLIYAIKENTRYFFHIIEPSHGSDLHPLAVFTHINEYENYANMITCFDYVFERRMS